MKVINKKTKKVISVTLVLIFSMSSILMLFPLNPTISENVNELDGEEKSTEMKSSSPSIYGDAPWWNRTFTYRSLINITNPYGAAFTDFIANIAFNYTNLVSIRKMNESLKDVRIVENGILRNYFIEKDFPKKDLATVWFETNISTGPDNTEYDTYMYHGYENASFASSYLMDYNPDGLMWFKFEEITANDEIIDSMNNYNATKYGGVTLSTDDKKVGNAALEFDGSTGYLRIQDKYYNSPNILSELTVCVFFKTGYSSGTYSNNWAFFDYDRSEYFNFYIRPNDGTLGFSSSAKYWDESDSDTGFDSDPTDDYDDFQGTTDLVDSANPAWHFGAAVYNGNDKILYSDGGIEDGFTEDARNVNAHQGNAIGGRRTANPATRYGIIGDGSEASSYPGGLRNNIYYDGLIDEIRFFEKALPQKRIEWLAKRYVSLDTKLNDPQEKKASITLIAKDIDGRVIPGLDVYMYNNTVPSHDNYTGTTSDVGYVEFPNVNRSRYIITANYSISNGTHAFERVVFNSSDHNIIYDFSGGDFFTIYINVSLWSIDFEIEDWDYDPMGYGYVLVYNKSGYTDLIANLTLDKEFGSTTFRWFNISDDAKYYYKIYYDNEDYDPQRKLVNSSAINRVDYLNKKLKTIKTINVNQTNIDERPEYFLVQERVYATGSDINHIGNTKIINTTIDMSDMDDSLDRVEIYSIDAYNNETSAIFTKDYLIENSDTIKLNVSEFGDAYGLLISVSGTNSSQVCKGTIDITYTETCNQYVRVNMSKLEIKVYDTEGLWDPEWGSVRVHIKNGTVGGLDITTLRTNDQGIAKGYKNSDLDFWFFTNTKYNFTLEYGGDFRFFNVTSDQHFFPPNTWWLEVNYTLYNAATIECRIRTSIADFATEFQEETWDNTSEWGQDFIFRVRFLSTANGGQDWEPVIEADFVDWEITDLLGDNVYDSGEMAPETDGYFNYTINSGFLIGGVQYYFKVYGEKTGYQNPAPLQLLFTVSTKATNIGVYNTSNPTQNLGNNVTLYYGETIQLTVFYSSGGLLGGATVNYEWQFLDNPIAINETSPGYYSFEIDTSIADVGTYKIDINAAQLNYTSQYFRFDVVIVHRPTSLNDDTSLHHIPKILWVRQSYNFTFEYKDILSEPHVNLIDLDQAYYQWYEVSANGSIGGAISGKIDLVEGLNSTYILDFNTNSREVGYYAIFVTMQKNNYEVRTALIDLTIQKRIITWDWNLVQNQIKIIQGEDVYLELSLTDLSDPTDPQSITGATVMLILGSQEYELTDDDGDGVYIYTFTTDNIDTFFAQQVFTGEISISKEDFISDSIAITIVVGMTEIFPGFPMFYFLMIVGSAVAIVGSLTTYRIVQQRRIPTFVKKARSMKKSIKGNKAVSDSLLYPSKDEFIVTKLGDKWDTIGLSLEDILEVKEKKKMKLSEAKEEFKGGAD